MTDNEIIKALECCKEAKLQKDCLDLKCPLSTEYGCNFEQEELRNKALDLINRQQAEIERLQNAYKQCAWERDTFLEEQKSAKSEAIKKFAERLKNTQRIRMCDGYIISYIPFDEIDSLKKEMVGDAE